MDAKRYFPALLALSGAGLLLRLWNIDFGLPLEMHADEPSKILVVGRLLRGASPGYFLHPGLLVNVTALFTWVHGLFGGGTARGDILLHGRILSAVLGALTILPTGFLGTTLFGRKVGLLAAAFLAVSPIHVVHSRYLKEDALLALWVMVCLCFLVRWIRSGCVAPKSKYLVLAAAAAGLSVSSKFVGFSMVLLAAYGCLACIRDERKQWLSAGLVLGISAGVFLAISTPQLRGGLQVIVEDLGFEISHGVFSNDRPSLAIWQWPDLGTYFFYHGIARGMTWPLAIVGLCGVVLGLRRSREDPGLRIVVVCAILWYVLAELTPIKRGVDVERYILPCIPILCIVAAQFLLGWGPAMGFRWNPSRRSWGSCAGLLLLLCAWRSIAVSAASVPDTRVLAAEWLARHGPQAPYRIAYCDDRFKQLDESRVPSGKLLKVSFNWSKEEQMAMLARAQVLTLSSFYTDRYERFPRLDNSRKALNRLRRLRGEFPHGYRIAKPAWAKRGFHNPDIEIRFRGALPEEALGEAFVRRITEETAALQ